MVIRIKVQTRASVEKVEQLDLDEYKVWVTAPAYDNQANQAVIDIFSYYFSPSRRDVRSDDRTERLI